MSVWGREQMDTEWIRRGLKGNSCRWMTEGCLGTVYLFEDQMRKGGMFVYQELWESG